MTEHIVGHILKAITYYHLRLKICTCNTIRGCATIKINYENKVICTRIVTHWATIRICATNRVNTVFLLQFMQLSKYFYNPLRPKCLYIGFKISAPVFIMIFIRFYKDIHKCLTA